MNLKRAIGISVLMYLATFAFGLLIGVVLNTAAIDVEKNPAVWWIAGILFAIIFSILGALWYFRSPTTLAESRNGLFFGLIAVFTGFSFDILTVLLTGNSVPAFVSDYYGKPLFWVTVVCVLGVTTFTGKVLQLKHQAESNSRNSE